MKTKKIHSLSLLVVFLLLQGNCRSLNPFHKEVANYHSPDFECFDDPGWRDNKKFLKYMEIWSVIRGEYHKDNSRIKRARTVIVGNSLVHLFTPDLIEKELPNRGVVNRGIGGDMSETLLLRIEKDVLSLQPRTVVIEIGGNDLIQGKCLSLTEKNVHSLIAKIRGVLPRTRIIFLAVPPTDVSNLNAVVPAYNTFLAGLPRQYPNLIFLDTWTDMRDGNLPTIDRRFLREGGKDKIHFNAEGYSVWGKMLRPHL